MSITITIEEAQANLKDLVHGLAPGDEIILTENQQTIAKIVSEQTKAVKQRPARRIQGLHGVKLLLDTHTPLWLASGMRS
jgi:antitoxin (DNA-binding transcriptional repressor) of toxin-antitoxin stability system